MAAWKQLSGDRETSFHTSAPLCGAARTIKAIGTCRGPSKQHNCHSNGIRRASPLKAGESSVAVQSCELDRCSWDWKLEASYLSNCGFLASWQQSCLLSIFFFSRLFLCSHQSSGMFVFFFWHCTQEGHSTYSHVLRERGSWLTIACNSIITSSLVREVSS